MTELQIPARELVETLLALADDEPVCLLDSCGVPHLGSRLLIAGIRPVETQVVPADRPERALSLLKEASASGLAGILTLSYELGAAMQNIEARGEIGEPGLFLALFDTLVVHDYLDGTTRAVGRNPAVAVELLGIRRPTRPPRTLSAATRIQSGMSAPEHRARVGEIKELIRRGDTYQTNLTRRITAEIPDELTPADIFRNIRAKNPVPFAAFIRRGGSTVVSASPERFFSIDGRVISASPVKGTRPRGTTPESDRALRLELERSEKDRAENVMIVDLLRNDLGRVCKFGSVAVEKLCEIEEHPTYFHMTSTVSGSLVDDVGLSEVLAATFPCGSITGAPKLRTMEIIERLEPSPRGLSMGAIGYFTPDDPVFTASGLKRADLSVAIRTMVVRGGRADFNVGGGIVIDSDPGAEYRETEVKSLALLRALGIDAR